MNLSCLPNTPTPFLSINMQWSIREWYVNKMMHANIFIHINQPFSTNLLNTWMPVILHVTGPFQLFLVFDTQRAASNLAKQILWSFQQLLGLSQSWTNFFFFHSYFSVTVHYGFRLRYQADAHKLLSMHCFINLFSHGQIRSLLYATYSECTFC